MSTYVPAVSPMSRREIEAEAEQIIQCFYPDLLERPGEFPVLDFFDHCLPGDFGLDSGVEVLSDGIEGITYPDGRVLLSETTYRGAHNGNGRDRYTAAHECFHGIKHRNQIRHALVHSGGLVLYRRPEVPPYRDPEWQANVFASAVLMPAEMVRRVVRRASPFNAENAVMITFAVSRQAAGIRVKQVCI